MIFRRKSFHIFRNVGNESISKDELNDIQSAYSEFTPLNPEIERHDERNLDGWGYV